ncbi:RCC1 domain-containing protein [Francisella philomiragia]|uniref:Regulator n=1 Tax=Francisella philomiragia TaxID=28110 RepID=A0ABS1GDC1_9GAMM|nr:regulator [Francisella philomiragia]MBK2259131.1 regulator [Francisella philomiragia]MBK2302832.1 regulator [Francisella philomiragia]
MKRIVISTVLMSFLCIAFANTTFTQSFFGEYDHSTGGSFAYENNSYRDDGKIQKYNNKFSKDNSNSYNCRFDGDGELKCGNYSINTSSKHTDKDAAKKISRHYKKLKDVKDVSKGDDFNCALDDKKDVYCWGSNKRGQLGSDTNAKKVKKPLRVNIDNSINFKKVYTKAHYACALDEEGHAYCWGDGTNGEVGNGEKGLFDKPQKVQTDIEFSRLSMATTYTCGIEKDTNDLYCWGKSQNGQRNLDSTVPVKM